MDSFIRYERKGEPLVSREDFLRRLGRNASVALSIIGISLIVGILGYRTLEGMFAKPAKA